MQEEKENIILEKEKLMQEEELNYKNMNEPVFKIYVSSLEELPQGLLKKVLEKYPKDYLEKFINDNNVGLKKVVIKDTQMGVPELSVELKWKPGTPDFINIVTWSGASILFVGIIILFMKIMGFLSGLPFVSRLIVSLFLIGISEIIYVFLAKGAIALLMEKVESYKLSAISSVNENLEESGTESETILNLLPQEEQLLLKLYEDYNNIKNSFSLIMRFCLKHMVNNLLEDIVHVCKFHADEALRNNNHKLANKWLSYARKLQDKYQLV